MGNGSYGVSAKIGKDRSNKVWRFAQIWQRASDAYGQQRFANLVFSWDYETADDDYIIRPLSTTVDYGDTIDKTVYTNNIVSSTYSDKTIGATEAWDDQASISSEYISIPESTSQSYINFA